jgi:Porin PorA
VRRNFGHVLLGFGGLLLAVAVLALVWAPGAVKKTPLDVVSKTVYEGEGGKINTATGEFNVGPVYAVQETKSDSENSSDDHVLFVETSCLVVDTGGERECVDDSDPNLLTADIDIFATDRTSGLAVEDDNLPENAGPHEGLVNKWPFDVEKKTYPYWDGLVGTPIDMVFEDTETIQGLETYRFVATVEDEPVDVAEGVAGTYSNVVTVNVDPKTGAIVKGGQDQQRYLENGTQVLDVDIEWTAATIDDAIDDAKSNGRLLTMLLTVVPILGFVGGALAVVAGLLLLRTGRSERRAAPSDA